MTDKSALRQAETRPPILPKVLDDAAGPLVDESVWNDVQLTGDLVAEPELSSVSLRRTRLVDAKLSGSVIDQLHCTSVEFLRCDLSGAIWDSAFLDRVAFRDCRMTGLVLSGAKLADVRIEGCGAELMSLRMTKAKRLHVESSVLRAADFQEATIAQSRLEYSDLRGASFQRAQLQDVSLRGSKLDDIAGAGSMRGARVTPDQAVMLGGLLLAEAGIEVEDTHESS